MTNREVEVLRFVVDGLTNKEIAARMSISHRTVASHLRRTYEKIRATNRADATAYAIRNGLVEQ